MTPERLYQLIESYCSNSLTLDECEELYDYLESKRNDVPDIKDNTLTSNSDIPALDIARSEKILEKIKKDPRFIAAGANSTSEPIVKINRTWRWLSAAASVLIVSSLSLWFFTGKKDQPLAKTVAQKTLTSAAILPGKKKAIISISSNSANSYTTIATPKAAEYHLTLPDGSEVWLNSSSSVRYATAFSGKLRKVYLTGEAYFEVAKNKKRPFHVEANGVTIKVLGTHFNVTSYKPGIVQTALLEGSVIVEAKNKQAKLKPGQQVVASNQHLLVSAADTEEAVAWKNGFFKFQDEDIKSIMEKVAMWYDIEVEFQDNTDTQKFCGVFSKSKSLSELLSSFEAVGNLRFKTEGRRVTVMK